MKKIIKSIHPPLIYTLLICMIFVFMNCSLLNGLTNNGADQSFSTNEIVSLCSTSDPGVSFNIMHEEKQIYTSENGSNLKVTFCNSYAHYTNDLLLDSPEKIFIANNDLDPTGTTLNVGKIDGRNELIFSIEVQNTGYTYFTGPASRNPDGLVHAQVFEIESNLFFIGFEDQFNGGDKDYNDMSFIVYIESDE